MSEKVIVKFKKSHPKAVIPTAGSAEANGFDLIATSMEIEKNGLYIQYGTGIHVAIPKGYCGILQARSSVSKKSLILANGVGLIDTDYRGEILARFKVIRTDNAQTAEEYQIGDAVAQLRICPVPAVEYVEVEDLDATERGHGGFGSTDEKKKKKAKV